MSLRFYLPPNKLKQLFCLGLYSIIIFGNLAACAYEPSQDSPQAEIQPPNLMKLPYELLVKICSHVEDQKPLTITNHKFNQLADDFQVWEARLKLTPTELALFYQTWFIQNPLSKNSLHICPIKTSSFFRAKYAADIARILNQLPPHISMPLLAKILFDQKTKEVLSELNSWKPSAEQAIMILLHAYQLIPTPCSDTDLEEIISDLIGYSPNDLHIFIHAA